MEKIIESDGFIVYRSSCACFSKDHCLDAFVNIEHDKYCLSLWFNYNCHSPYSVVFPYTGKWYEKIWYYIKESWRRISLSIKLIFLGDIKMEGDFIFRNIEEVESFLETFSSHVKKYKGENTNGR